MESYPQKVVWCWSQMNFPGLEIRNTTGRSLYCFSTGSIESLIRPWIAFCFCFLPSAESPCTFTPLASRKLRQASTFSICREDDRQSAQRTDTARMWRYLTFNEPKCLGPEGSGDVDIITHKAHHCVVITRPPLDPGTRLRDILTAVYHHLHSRGCSLSWHVTHSHTHPYTSTLGQIYSNFTIVNISFTKAHWGCS